MKNFVASFAMHRHTKKPRACRSAACLRTASYSLPGAPAAFCASHRGDAMTAANQRRCAQPDCAKPAYFALAGQPRPTRCASHREPGMLNVVSKPCVECRKTPSFAPAGCPPSHCATHRLPGMTNVRKKPCSAAGCTTSSVYRWPFAPPSHCARHRLPGQIARKQRCACGRPPAFSTPDLSLFLCHGCREQTSAQEIVDHRVPCARCALRLTPDYLFLEGDQRVCETCREGASFVPGQVRVETTIVALLEQTIAECARPWHATVAELRKDRPAGDCRRRPDVSILLAGAHHPLRIVVEIDEYQHRSYSCVCEQRRMLEIANELLRPDDPTRLVFVRLNPDGYAPHQSKQYHRTPTELARRVRELDHTIQLLHDRRIVLDTGKCCSVAYLFYDNYAGLELLQL